MQTFYILIDEKVKINLINAVFFGNEFNRNIVLLIPLNVEMLLTLIF